MYIYIEFMAFTLYSQAVCRPQDRGFEPHSGSDRCLTSKDVSRYFQDADKMKRDINFAKNVMQADFDAKLQQKAIELWVVHF